MFFDANIFLEFLFFWITVFMECLLIRFYVRMNIDTILLNSELNFKKFLQSSPVIFYKSNQNWRILEIWNISLSLLFMGDFVCLTFFSIDNERKNASLLSYFAISVLIGYSYLFRSIILMTECSDTRCIKKDINKYELTQNVLRVYLYIAVFKMHVM